MERNRNLPVPELTQTHLYKRQIKTDKLNYYLPHLSLSLEGHAMHYACTQRDREGRTTEQVVETEVSYLIKISQKRLVNPCYASIRKTIFERLLKVRYKIQGILRHEMSRKTVCFLSGVDESWWQYWLQKCYVVRMAQELAFSSNLSLQQTPENDCMKLTFRVKN